MPAACGAFSLGLAAEQEHGEQLLVRESILGRRGSASRPSAPLLQPAPGCQAGAGRAHSGILPALEEAIKVLAPHSAPQGR